MTKIPAWSYSSLKTYETCPRKYQAEKVTKEVVFKDNDSTIYGKEVHLAAEEFIRSGKSIDPRFGYMLPILDRLNNIPGTKFCEIKFGLKKEDGKLVTCDFFDRDVWFRGVADLVILNGNRGWVIDYKTSKSAKYADTRQLALMAACMFAKYPQLEKVKAALLFVVAKDNALVEAKYTREDMYNIFADVDNLLTQWQSSYENDVWNEKPNGLCSRWCGVVSCPHNGANN